MDKKIKIIKMCSIFVVLILFCIIGFFSYQNFNKPNEIVENENISKTKEFHFEYGEKISLKRIFPSLDEKDIVVSEDLSTLNKVGTYNLQVKIKEEEFLITLFIEDTQPPILSVQEVTMYIDEEIPSVFQFVSSCNDESTCILEISPFEKKLGTQEVEIIAKDKYENKIMSKTRITILEDKEAPVFSGLSNIELEIGNHIDLKKGVKAIDERFGEVDFTYDDSKVNYEKLGSYFISYQTKDPLGNKTTKTRNITIKPKDTTYKINHFPTYNQYPNYPNGCESIALYNLLRYYKIEVSPNQIVESLKKGDGPYWKNNQLYGGNPEIEFVGDPRDSHGYGVYQKPIMNVANYYKTGMIDYTGHSLNDVLDLVKENIPVQVWTSINNQDTKLCSSWIYVPTGEKINWICNLHSVVIVGFNSNSIFVSDSYTGNIETYNRSQFEKMFNLFGKRAIYYQN